MYRSILVGSDGSSTASIAVDRAVELATTFDAKLTICSVGSPEDTTRVLAAESERLADRGVTIEAIGIGGEPAVALVDLAENGDYDLLIVGNKGMKGAMRLLGSVPDKVSHHARCPLLIVRTT